MHRGTFFIIFDHQERTQAVDSYLQRVVTAPVVLKHGKSFAEKNIRHVVHATVAVGSHQDQKEVNAFRVEWVHLRKSQGKLGFLNCLVPNALLYSYLAKIGQGIDVVFVVSILRQNAFGPACLDEKIECIVIFIFRNGINNLEYRQCAHRKYFDSGSNF